jgi:hypothetical protein
MQVSKSFKVFCVDIPAGMPVRDVGGPAPSKKTFYFKSTKTRDEYLKSYFNHFPNLIAKYVHCMVGDDVVVNLKTDSQISELVDSIKSCVEAGKIMDAIKKFNNYYSMDSKIVIWDLDDCVDPEFDPEFFYLMIYRENGIKKEL